MKQVEDSDRGRELEKRVEQMANELEEMVTAFPWEDRAAYAQWLAQTFYFVSHSTRLLALTCSRLDPMASDLHHRFIDHLREEKGHERMALSDFKALRIGELVPELLETQAFYQVQYHWIEYVSPLSFFGYILCLEATAVRMGNRVYERVRSAHGQSASVFLQVHVQDDVDHLAKAIAHVKTMSPAEQDGILKNFELSCHLYRGVYTRILGDLRAQRDSRNAA